MFEQLPNPIGKTRCSERDLSIVAAEILGRGRELPKLFWLGTLHLIQGEYDSGVLAEGVAKRVQRADYRRSGLCILRPLRRNCADACDADARDPPMSGIVLFEQAKSVCV